MWASVAASAATEKDTFELRDGATGGVRGLRPFSTGRRDTRSASSPGPAASRSAISMIRGATRKTFPVVDGQRVVISGDRGSLASDGTMRLFGRDSLVINTGGEKVFVEEVEEVLRAHPAIADALVVGRPSERWGQEVVALVALRDGVEVVHEQLHAHCTSAVGAVQGAQGVHLRRPSPPAGNGKADYRWAKSAATQQESLT